MKASLKSLVQREPGNPRPSPAVEPLLPPETAAASQSRGYRQASTRIDTRQVSAHFKPEVAQTLKLIAAEQDRDVQELLAEALNMLFGRYGKQTRIELVSGRRKREKTT